jgi:hypothetical protein
MSELCQIPWRETIVRASVMVAETTLVDLPRNSNSDWSNGGGGLSAVKSLEIRFGRALGLRRTRAGVRRSASDYHESHA